jgi:hypothetical protein
VLAWPTIAYGAALSTVAAALAALGVGPRRPAMIITAGPATGLGAVAWNAILHATRAGHATSTGSTGPPDSSEVEREAVVGEPHRQ